MFIIILNIKHDWKESWCKKYPYFSPKKQGFDHELWTLDLDGSICREFWRDPVIKTIRWCSKIEQKF